jgi:hypothetical protein
MTRKGRIEMGWASGSSPYDFIIEELKECVPDEALRPKIHESLIRAFEEHDWDTQDECVGQDPAFDAALEKLHPDWYEEEDES